MGLPKITINFFSKLIARAKRSAAGTVVLILKDDVQTATTVTYKGVGDIVTTEWSPENLDIINKTMLGEPGKLIIEVVPVATVDYATVLARLVNKKFDYLAIPGIETLKVTDIVTWIKAQRDTGKKKFKAVLPNATSADHEGIINFTTAGITVAGAPYTTSEYTARVAGALAGLPFSRSATYLVFPEVDSITEIADPDVAVDNGELILINDGEKIKIGRGVNSLKTIAPGSGKSEEFKSIRIVETMDLIREEIYTNFSDNYVGQVPNIYDNQVLFISDINTSFKELGELELLDPDFESLVTVDVVAQREAHELNGTDTSTWDDDKVRNTSYKRNVFLAGKIRMVDTMEDLQFNIEI